MARQDRARTNGVLPLCWLALLTMTALVALGCGQGQPRPRGDGPGRREQTRALDPRQELAIGRRAYQEVVRELGDRVLPRSHPEVVRLRTVLDRIVRASEIEPLQREINLQVRGYRFEWEANVVDDDQLNAFCLPAGKIFFFLPMMRFTENADDHLATVVAHEVAHALAHHASERIARDQSGRGILRNLSHSRMQESEADHIGVFLMAFAGYDPARAVSFWQRMQRARGGRGARPEIFSDHPGEETRIRDLQKWSREAKAARQAFDQGRIAPPGR